MEEKSVNQGKIRKQAYWAKLQECLDEYKNILVIGVDFVGSQQLQETRIMLRGKARMLMGKNTIIRKVFRERIEAGQTSLEALLPAVYGNIGFVFTNSDLAPIRKMVTEKKLPAAAKAGLLAPKDVIIPAGPSGLDPGQTSFFQALNIGTKIVKGSVELLNDVTVAREGTKVSTSAVALLNKLGLKPFEYGITASYVYENGAVYTVEVLDMTDDDLVKRFVYGANQLAAVCFSLGYVNQATIPHSFMRVFKTLCAVASASGYMFDEFKEVKEKIDNPDAFRGAGGGGGGGGGGAAAPAAKAPEPEPEEEAAPAVDMFGGGGSDY